MILHTVRVLRSVLITVGLALTASYNAEAATTNCTAEDVACLVSAIHAANTSGDTSNTIVLEAGTYTLTTIDNDLNGPTGLPSITGTMTIKSAGPGAVTIQRASTAPRFRLFYVANSGNLILESVNLFNGFAVSVSRDIPGSGGAIANLGHIRITDSTMMGNGASSGCAIYNAGQTMVLTSRLLQNVTGCASAISSSGDLTLDQSRIANNIVSGTATIRLIGGSATVTECFIVDNTAAFDAGGIYTTSTTVDIRRTTFSHNGAEGVGAILVGSGSLSISDSAFIRNGRHDPGSAGDIFNNGGTVTVVNTSFLQNNSHPSAKKGRSINNSRGEIFLLNSTVVQVSSGVTGDASSPNANSIFTADTGAKTTLQNTILTHVPAVKVVDCAGPTTSLGNNVISTLTDCGIALQPTDLVADPQLDAYADNGQPGNGHFALLPTSPAIDAGAAACPAKDQIGQSRFGPCDIGAIEFVPPITTVTVVVHPGSDSGAINPNSKGVTPVAMLATDTFDPTTVNTSTIRFGKSGTEASPLRYSQADVDGDGRIDLVMHFKTQEIGMVCGDTTLLLSGRTFGTAYIKGTVSIVTVGCAK